MSAALNLTVGLSRALALVFSFSLFVLAAISIRWGHTVYASYFKVDPAAIVLGVLAFLYFLFITVAKSLRSSALKTKVVVAVAAFFTLFYLGIAISYSALRNDGIYDPAIANNTPTGNIFRAQGGLIKALMAVSWIGFFFHATFVVSLVLLAKKHATLPWTNRENGMDVPYGYLMPAEPKQDQMAPKH